MYGDTCSKSMDQPGKVANPARGQLNREISISLYAFAPENLGRETGSAVSSRASLLLSSSAVASIYLFKPPYDIGSVPSLSGHAIAYRWRSLPRVRRHRASKPQGSSKRVLPWQVTMYQFICASLSHTH